MVRKQEKTFIASKRTTFHEFLMKVTHSRLLVIKLLYVRLTSQRPSIKLLIPASWTPTIRPRRWCDKSLINEERPKDRIPNVPLSEYIGSYLTY